jgi:hypothetical protein
MSDLEIGVLLDYSSLKSQLSTMMTGIGKQFQNVLGTGLDLNKASMESFKTMNWSPILSKLFAPANLIAMFSAMAALGITSAIQNQQNVTNVPGGANLTPTQRGEITNAAIGISNATGINASDIATSIMTLKPALGNNIDATNQLAMQVAKVASTTGDNLGTLSGAFGAIIQTLGITNIDDATALLQSFENAASQSGQQVSTLMNSWENFNPKVKEANIGQRGINNAIQEFGAAVEGAGLPAATAAFTLLFDSITPTQSQMAFSNLAGGANKLKQAVADGQTGNALNGIADAVKKMEVDGNIELLNSQFGITSSVLAGIEGNLNTWPIDKQKTIDDAFNNTNTAVRQLNDSWQTFKNLLASGFTNTGFINFLTTTITDLNNLLPVLGNVSDMFLSLWKFLQGGWLPDALTGLGKLFQGNPLGDFKNNTTTPFADNSLSTTIADSLKTIAKNTDPNNQKPVNFTPSFLLSTGGSSASSSLQNALYGIH